MKITPLCPEPGHNLHQKQQGAIDRDMVDAFQFDANSHQRYQDMDQVIDGYVQLGESKPKEIPESAWPGLIDLFQQKIAPTGLSNSAVSNLRKLLAMQVDDVAAPSSNESILEEQRQVLNAVSEELRSLGIGNDYFITPLTKKEQLDYVGDRVPIFSSGEMRLFTSVFIKDNRKPNVLLSRESFEYSGTVLSQIGFDQEARTFVQGGRLPRIILSQSLRLKSHLYSSLLSECLHYANIEHVVDRHNALLKLLERHGVRDPITHVAGLSRVIEEAVTHGIVAHCMINTILPLHPEINDIFWQDTGEKLGTFHYKGVKAVIPLANGTSRRDILDQYRNNFLNVAQHIVNAVPEFKQRYFGDIVKPRSAVSGKIGRNETCPCKSGKKYKHCCGKNL